MKITKVSQRGIDLIKKYEGLKLAPYLCPANIPTIGYGSTFYSNGVKVKMADAPITEGKASELLRNLLITFEKGVDSFTTDLVSQNQFDALVSFAYNCGLSNLKSSTLIKKVNINPNDPTIKAEFLKWNRGGGKVLAGLTKRRQEEADLYFS